MPSGGNEGDKVYILITYGGGNERMETAYEYTWHEDGGNEAKENMEEKIRQEKEKSALDSWNNKKTSYSQSDPIDPNYKDSGIRANKIWGQVMIRRGDDDDDGYEILTERSIIYHGDRIKTIKKSGVQLSFTNMSTYVIEENTIMIMPEPEKNVSRVKIVVGNI